MESLARPSPPDVVADAVDAVRGRSRDRVADQVEVVLGLLRELKESGQVKGYAADVWVGLGVHRGDAAHRAELWWSVGKWRKAAAQRARRDLVATRRAEARREEERARRESSLHDAVERTLEQRRRDARNPYEGPDPL
ncbi:hypothetical protein ACH4KO_33940 [Streptomyces anulatus]